MEQGHTNQGYHIPVLYHETLNGLNIKPDGIYVDCTFGVGVIAQVFYLNLMRKVNYLLLIRTPMQDATLWMTRALFSFQKTLVTSNAFAFTQSNRR